MGILPFTELIKLKTIKSSLTSYFLSFSLLTLSPLSLLLPTLSACASLTHSLIHTHTHIPFSCLLPCWYFLMPRALFFFFILFSHPSFSGLSCPSKYDLPEDEDHILVIFAFPASCVASSTLEILSGAWGKVQSVCGFVSPDSRTKVMSVSNNGAFSQSCIYVEVLFCYGFKLGLIRVSASKVFNWQSSSTEKCSLYKILPLVWLNFCKAIEIYLCHNLEIIFSTFLENLWVKFGMNVYLFNNLSELLTPLRNKILCPSVMLI